VSDRIAPTEGLCEQSPWDSDFFGFRVARTTRTCPDVETVSVMLAWCRERHVRCLYHSADPDCLPGNAAVASAGFQLVDIRHEMEAPAVARDVESSSPSVVRDAAPRDQGDLVQLARTAFRDSRFTRDPGFPQDRVSDMYELWLTNALETGRVFVASATEKARGFITCVPEGDGLTIGLLAVSEESRGLSYGGLLVRRVVELAQQEGLSSIRVVTQGSNVPALRTYEAAGFETTRVSISYHRWF
jgi:dTDP-4-amino-4,6-dideoxy-D-galactose acyltransferase